MTRPEERFCMAARECAIQMSDNSHYIRQHLAEVSLPKDTEVRIETLCQHLVTTHQKAMSTMADLSGWTEATRGFRRKQVELMVEILSEPIALMNCLIKEIYGDPADPRFFLGRLLVTESVTNILNTFNEAADSGDLILILDTDDSAFRFQQNT
jgi:hypothetical protein